jgi:hypothetical protein
LRGTHKTKTKRSNFAKLFAKNIPVVVNLIIMSIAAARSAQSMRLNLVGRGVPPAVSEKAAAPKHHRDENASAMPRRASTPTKVEQPDERLVRRKDAARSPVRQAKVVTPEKAVVDRSFGEEIDANMTEKQEHEVEQQPIILDTSHISIETKDTVISTLSTDDQHSTTGSQGSECAASEVSSVAHLRGWLDDFGKQQKMHYEKNVAKPTSEALQRPVRPKVHRASISVVNPTPLPPQAASALARRMTPLKPNTEKGASPTLEQLRRAQYATPIRFKPAVKNEDVQATNEGYASVAKLSRWLADDPTKPVKVRQIRRGANVIAKSRRFDKGLAGVILEENSIQRGGVAQKMQQIEKSLSHDVADDDDDDSVSVHSTMTVDKRDWLGPGPSAASSRRASFSVVGSSVSVSDKKKWLSSAFQKPEESLAVKKSTTDIVTNRDRTRDAGRRAKQMWRNRTPTNKRSPSMSPQRTTSRSPIRASSRSPVRASSHSPVRETLLHRASERAARMTTPQKTLDLSTMQQLSIESSTDASAAPDGKIQGEPAKEIAIKSSADTQKPHELTESQSSDKVKEKFEPFDAPLQTKSTDSETRGDESYALSSHGTIDSSPSAESVNFRQARELLVQRSKANGNDVEVVSKVKLRKSKYEMIHKEARRKSSAHGLFKTTWESGGPSYVKKYVPDIAPKKSFEELP